MQGRLELEEVQALPRALDSVMRWLLSGAAIRTGQPRGLAAHHEINATLCDRKIHRRNRQRRGQTQSLSEEFFHPPSLPSALRCGKRHPHETRQVNNTM
jgi:hypothetical protein